MTSEEISEHDPIWRSAGNKRVILEKARYSGFDITLCSNGYQSTVVNVDVDMLEWLTEILNEHKHATK